jgi:hypothetical protein
MNDTPKWFRNFDSLRIGSEAVECLGKYLPEVTVVAVESMSGGE